VPSHDPARPGALPLRPLTTGELLDAAVVLARAQAGRLFALGAVVALAEQVALFWLRRSSDVDSSFLPADDKLRPFGYLMVLSFFTEMLAIAVLGGTAAARAPRVLLGSSAPAAAAVLARTARRPIVPGQGRAVPMILAGLLAAAIGCTCAWSFLILPIPLQVLGLVLALFLTGLCWVVLYGLLGLVAPAVVIDGYGPFRALGRTLRLSSRGFFRVGWIRILGYLSWLIVRLTLAEAVVGLVTLVYTSPSSTVDRYLMGSVWLVVNALAYPILGCLDVALHLESRMRTEGLDIALTVSLRRNTAGAPALVSPTPTLANPASAARLP
jgi:hypothetical protein